MAVHTSWQSTPHGRAHLVVERTSWQSTPNVRPHGRGNFHGRTYLGRALLMAEHSSWHITRHGTPGRAHLMAERALLMAEHSSWQSTPRRGRVSFTFKRARICLRHGRVRKKQFGRHPMCGNRICLRRAGIAGNGQNTARYYTVPRVQKKTVWQTPNVWEKNTGVGRSSCAQFVKKCWSELGLDSAGHLNRAIFPGVRLSRRGHIRRFRTRHVHERTSTQPPLKKCRHLRGTHNAPLISRGAPPTFH